VPHSEHIRLLQQAGFRIVCDLTVRDLTSSDEFHPAPRFAHLSLEDRKTSGAFIQAVKGDPVKKEGME
jgi:hypothetical protein